MKQIPLSRGKFAIVDDDMYEFLMKWKWVTQTGRRTFYAYTSIYPKGKSATNRTFIKMHRLITNAPADKMVDHINGNGLDNRKSNLRVVTNQQNMLNQSRVRKNTSGHLGVSWTTASKRWMAQIKINKKNIYLGMFDSLEDAIAARKDGEEKYFSNVLRKEG